MFKKTILVPFLFVFLFSFNLARASVIINEIMYNPAGNDSNREWVELYNNGNDTVSVVSGKTDSAWRFDDGSTSLHYLNDDLAIPAGGYAILTDDKTTFLSEYPSFSGLVADTSIALNNTGIIKIWNGSKDTGSVVDSVSYDFSSGADNDGNSLQLINGSWQAGVPTPGVENVISQTNNNNNSDTTNTTGDTTNNTTSSSNVTTSSNSSTTTTKTKVVENPKIKTKIYAKTLAFLGMPIEFSASTTGYSNEALFYGKYFWNFGDGDSKETGVNSTVKFMHTFLYEGEYPVALEYFQNNNSMNPDASDRITIKVIKADILISNVGDLNDFFVEILNNTAYDADLSKWILAGNGKIFTLPNNTILGSKKKIILSSRITGFSVLDKDTLKLLNPQGEIIFNYSYSVAKISKPSINNNSIIAKTPKENSVISTFNKPILPDTKDGEISFDNLGAVAVKSDENTSNTKDNFIYGIFGLFAFLGISASATYFIRNRNRKAFPEKAGNDFEIIDE